MFETLQFRALGDDADDLRAAVRAVLARDVAGQPAAVRARSWMRFDRAFSRALGAAGLIGTDLPARFGGQARGPLARFAVSEELLAVGAPVAAHWIAERQSAPLLLHYGTPAQQERLIPGIVRGELSFCIGMSEPDSGSDLASIRSRATRAEGGGWQLTGQKIWTTHAHNADYMIALVRTSGTAQDRQQGLSQVIVDLHAAGVTIRPIRDLHGDAHFSEVFFDAVALPDDALLGVEGEGWRQVTAELAFERSGPERILSSIVLLDAWIAHLQRHGRDDAATQERVGRLIAEYASLRALSIAVTARLEQGQGSSVEASLFKDLGTGFEQKIPDIVADDLASHPEQPADPDLLDALVYVTEMAPSFSLRGGTREVLRGIIARELGLR